MFKGDSSCDGGPSFSAQQYNRGVARETIRKAAKWERETPCAPNGRVEVESADRWPNEERIADKGI